MEDVDEGYRYTTLSLANLKDDEWEEKIFYYNEGANTIVGCVLDAELADNYSSKKVDIKLKPSDGGANDKGAPNSKRKRRKSSRAKAIDTSD